MPPNRRRSRGFSRLAPALAILVACSPGPRTTPGPITFEDVTEAAKLPAASERCVLFEDLDADGWPDLVLAPVDNAGRFTGELALHRNRGDGTFERSTLATGMTEILSCAAADFDRDGRLDLVTAGTYPNEPTRKTVGLYRGLGAFAFADASASLRPLVSDAPNVVRFVDVDVDGWPDLLVGSFDLLDATIPACEATEDDLRCPLVPESPGRPPLVLRNREGLGFERFEHQLPEAGLTLAFDVADWDGDGRPDLFVSNDHGRNRFYRNTPGGFVDVLPGWGAAPYNNGMGAAFADFDLDGALDVYVADVGPDQFWFGRGGWDGGVRNRAVGLGVAEATRFHWGWSPVAADFDNDGDADLFVANSALLHDSDDVWRALRHEPASRFPEQADFVFTNDRERGFSVGRVPHRDARPSTTDALVRAADFDRDGRLDLVVVLAVEVFEVRLLRNVTPVP